MKEIWKPIKGFNGAYEVSDLGRVRSLDREVAGRIEGVTQKIKGRILSLSSTGTKYLRVNLTKEGKGRKHYIHRLVLMSFKPLEGMDKLYCNHIDGNKHNNILNNLEWVTPSQNNFHAVENGFMASGRSHYLSLSLETCRQIRKELGSDSMVNIAKNYKVSAHTVYRINDGIHWSCYE